MRAGAQSLESGLDQQRGFLQKFMDRYPDKFALFVQQLKNYHSKSSSLEETYQDLKGIA